VSLRSLATPRGPSRAHVHRPPAQRRPEPGTLVLGHGAGGGIAAGDLQAVAAAVVDVGWAVALVEAPWRVAGRRVAAAPSHLDDGWRPVVDALRRGRGALPGRLVVGGRSAGARVACRTADAVGADAVLCLAFPLQPPGGGPSRAGELLGAGDRPVLVVQGRSDSFGSPDDVRSALAAASPAPGPQVVGVRGDHALVADLPAVTVAVVEWLAALIG
jgi:predicted alpha/beta-hydrolase family hydrolase